MASETTPGVPNLCPFCGKEVTTIVDLGPTGAENSIGINCHTEKCPLQGVVVCRSSTSVEAITWWNKYTKEKVPPPARNPYVSDNPFAESHLMSRRREASFFSGVATSTSEDVEDRLARVIKMSKSVLKGSLDQHEYVSGNDWAKEYVLKFYDAEYGKDAELVVTLSIPEFGVPIFTSVLNGFRHVRSENLENLIVWMEGIIGEVLNEASFRFDSYEIIPIETKLPWTK